MNTTAVALTALALLHCVMSAGVRVKASQGGNTSVHCPYHRGSEHYPKYFSKGRGEVEMVRAKSTTWAMEGRFSLEDDREKREFTVTIRNLSVDDAGLYWCGVDDWGPDTLTEVLLDVAAHILFNTVSSNTQNGEPLALAGWLAAVLLLCGISGILIKVKWNKAGRTTGAVPTSGHSREKANSEHAEEDYVRMKPNITQVDLPVNEEDSSLSGPHLPLELHQTGAADPPTPQQSNVYEHLRADSQQDSVYHTLDLTSR